MNNFSGFTQYVNFQHIKPVFAKAKTTGSCITGFTLIELLVVAAITAVFSTFMIINFQRTRLNLNETVNVLKEEIIATEAKANASVRFDDGGGAGLALRCGYGIHYEGISSYSIYVGPNATVRNCTMENRNLDANDFKILPIKNISDSRVEFKAAFTDIFFEPPSSVTFINNSSVSASINITIIKKGGTCPLDCKSINVSTNGTIR